MDEIIKQICKDAEEKISQRIETLTKELHVARGLNVSLEREVTGLEERVALVEAQAKDERERLSASIRSKSEEIAALQTHNVRSDASIHKQVGECRPPGEVHEERLAGNLFNTDMNHDSKQHEPITAVCCEHRQYLHKYTRLKSAFMDLQARHRKERKIWNHWIHWYEQRDDSRVAQSTERQPSGSPKALANLNLNTIDRTPDPSLHSQLAQDETQTSKSSLEPSQAHRSASCGPCLATVSPPPPRNTGTNSTARCKSALVGKLTPSVNNPRKRGRDDDTTRAILMFAEDDSSQGRTSTFTKSKVSPLSDKLHTPAGTVPGQRMTNHDSGTTNTTTTPTQARGVKRCRSEMTPKHTSSGIDQIAKNPRGIGRYSSGLATTKGASISDFLLNPQNRLNAQHAQNEVVRGGARKALHASDCACCSTFYKLAGSAVKTGELQWGSQEQQNDQAEDSRHVVGRHRSAWRRSPTPPTFWDCDFPTTQQLLDEKYKNEQRRTRKVQELERSAATDGRYIRKPCIDK